MGAVPPWREYMAAFIRESKHDRVAHGDESDLSVSLAWLRGRLRLAPLELKHPSGPSRGPLRNSPHTGDDRLLYEPVDPAELAGAVDGGDFSAAQVVEILLDVCGYRAVVAVIELEAHPGPSCLALAKSIAEGKVQEPDADSRYWAEKAVDDGLPPGELPYAMALGIDLAKVDSRPVEEARNPFLDLTRRVLDPPSYGETDQLREWIDGCAIAARRDSLGLAAAEALLAEDNCYTLWLRFAIAVARAEANSSERPKAGVDALRILLDPGESPPHLPQGTDLYSIQPLIEDTILRALDLLDEAAWNSALGLFHRVEAATTTLWAEVGGLLSFERLLRLAINSAPLSCRAALQSQLDSATDRRRVGIYYSDIAEHRCLKARLALSVGDSAVAQEQWMQICQLLPAYGWRKDATIFELLHSIPLLFSVAPARAREAVALVQPLCERVADHTDGKGTYHVPDVWWRLLAEADPCALSRLVQPALLSSCNRPLPFLDKARSHLWRSCHRRADPLIAAALRLTLEEPLDKADPTALHRLREEITEAAVPEASHLMVSLLARADERPFTHRVSNDDELLGEDNELVDEINAVAVPAAGPRVGPLPSLSHDEGKQKKHSISLGSRSERPRSLQAAPIFRPGAAGLTDATRAWYDNYYDERNAAWTVGRFSHALGYRLVELVQAGRPTEARKALQTIADSTRFDDRQGLLRAVAEGLERHGLTDLATTAYTLAWTRSRGGGGWDTFGGATNISSLRRAAELNGAVARCTVASETERFVSRQLGTIGITRALLCGFLKAGLGTSDSVAFDAWMEAFAVIEGRLPRGAGNAGRENRYTAPDPDSGAELLGDINASFAAATLAGLAHAGREQKRRSLLATQVLIDCRPLAAAPAVATALSTLSDPATLTWLLRTVALAKTKNAPVVSASRQALLDLAKGPHLTVRVLARRLLGAADIPTAPPTEPDSELVHGGPSELVLPPGIGVREQGSTPRDGVVDHVAGLRLSRSEPICPGLRDAVHRRVYETRQTDDHKRQIGAQYRAYADYIKKRIPNVFSAVHQAVESAVQRAAAGIRDARIRNGQSVLDPIRLEEHCLF